MVRPKIVTFYSTVLNPTVLVDQRDVRRTIIHRNPNEQELRIGIQWESVKVRRTTLTQDNLVDSTSVLLFHRWRNIHAVANR